MNKALISFLVFVVGMAVFHNAIFPIFTPKEIGWVLNRYVYFLLFVAYLIITNLILRLKPPIAMTALFVWGLGFYFYKLYCIHQFRGHCSSPIWLCGQSEPFCSSVRILLLSGNSGNPLLKPLLVNISLRRSLL